MEKHESNPSQTPVVENDEGNESTSKQENKEGTMASRAGGGPRSPRGIWMMDILERPKQPPMYGKLNSMQPKKFRTI